MHCDSLACKTSTVDGCVVFSDVMNLKRPRYVRDTIFTRLNWIILHSEFHSDRAYSRFRESRDQNIPVFAL